MLEGRIAKAIYVVFMSIGVGTSTAFILREVLDLQAGFVLTGWALAVAGGLVGFSGFTFRRGQASTRR